MRILVALVGLAVLAAGAAGLARLLRPGRRPGDRRRGGGHQPMPPAEGPRPRPHRPVDRSRPAQPSKEAPPQRLPDPGPPAAEAPTAPAAAEAPTAPPAPEAPPPPPAATPPAAPPAPRGAGLRRREPTAVPEDALPRPHDSDPGPPAPERPAPPPAATPPGAGRGAGPGDTPLATAPPDPALRPRTRFANAVLSDGAGARLDPSRPLVPGAVLGLRLSIGPLDRRSHVGDDTPFPDEVLPRRDVVLRVLVTSADFAVAASADALSGNRRSVEKAFLLPADGSPARAANGGQAWLDFALRAPLEGEARARIGYYYRDAPVQSQVLVSAPGGPGGFSIATDYTASAVLDDLDAIPDTPRLSIVTNTGEGGTHGIVLRPPGRLPAEATAFSLPDDTIGKMVDDLRRALADRAGGERARRRKDLVDDLRELAPLGRALYQQLFLQARDVLGELRRASPRPVVHIARPRHVRFTVPWNYLYEIALPDDVSDAAVCPLVADWDERSPLVAGPTDTCPRSGDVPHTKNLLCPFGFWGFSQTVEAPASSKDPAAEIPVAPHAVVAVAETTRVDRQALAAHVANLRSLFGARFADAVVKEGATKADILTLLSTDLPVAYFYCHGDKDRIGSPDTFLAVGDKEQIKATELIDLFDAGFAENRVIWDRVRPLVVINACHSLEISPATLVSYVDAFVGGGNAVGVIGTEVKVPQRLAMEWAESFFAALLEPGATAGQALRAARLAFLASGNLFGLVYTAHCWSHLRFTPEAAGAPA